MRQNHFYPHNRSNLKKSFIMQVISRGWIGVSHWNQNILYNDIGLLRSWGWNHWLSAALRLRAQMTRKRGCNGRWLTAPAREAELYLVAWRGDPIFPGKYHQTGGFLWAMLVSGRVMNHVLLNKLGGTGGLGWWVLNWFWFAGVDRYDFHQAWVQFSPTFKKMKSRHFSNKPTIDSQA